MVILKHARTDTWIRRRQPRSSMCSGLMTVAAVSALGGHSNDSMGGPATPMM